MNQFSPTKRVTDLLLRFLEFDPQQLQLGIWSGDVSLEQVRLRPDALEPLLKLSQQPQRSPSDTTLPRTESTSTLPPLVLQLVSGTIGSIRLRIPWKRLVWGQGDVQLEMDDVAIVVKYESRFETQARIEREQRKQKRKHDDENDNDDHHSNTADEYSNPAGQEQSLSLSSAEKNQETMQTRQRERERKQATLREAERRNLQGLPLADWLSSLTDQENEMRDQTGDVNHHETKPTIDTSSKTSSWDKWFQKASRDFLWRFCAGLQARINKISIVLIQEHLEMGLLIHSIDMKAGKSESAAATTQTAPNSTTPDEHDHSTEESKRPPSVPSSGDGTGGGVGGVILQYQGAYEDGEHVDKTIKIQGVGLFIRKEISQQKVHPSLAFSSYCTSDDFILRPSDIQVKVSLFLPRPNPTNKRKTGAVSSDANTLDAPDGIAGTIADATIDSSRAATETTTSSKRRRRGKRDKIIIGAVSGGMGKTQSGLSRATTTGAASTSLAAIRDNERGMSASSSMFVPPKMSRRGLVRSASVAYIRESSMLADAGAVKEGLDSTRYASMHASAYQSDYHDGNSQPSRTNPLLQRDDLSKAYASGAMRRSTAAATPRCDCQIQLQELFLCCSSRQLELLQRAWVGWIKMKRGRPDQTIQSVLYKASQDFGQQPTGTRFITVDAPVVPMIAETEIEARAPVPPPPPLFSETSRLTYAQRLTPSQSSQKQSETPQFLNTQQTSSASQKHSKSDRSQLPSKPSTPLLRYKTDDFVTMASPQHNIQRIKLQLHLQPPAIASDLSKLVRHWWKYAIDIVVAEVRRRQKLRSHFAVRNIAFDWEKVTYLRKEYVDLYLRTRLNRSSSRRQNHMDDELLQLEDGLSVEQILRYRATARALSVRRFTRMPDSILAIHGPGFKSHDGFTAVSPRKQQQGADLLSSSKEIATNTQANEEPSLLTRLRNECKATRTKLCLSSGEDSDGSPQPRALNVEPMSPLMRPDSKPASLRSPTKLNTQGNETTKEGEEDKRNRRNSIASLAVESNRGGNGLSTVAFRPDSVEIRTVKTFQTSKSRQSSTSALTGLVLDDISKKGPTDDAAMRYSVILSFARVDVVLLHDVFPVEGSVDGHKSLVGTSADVNINEGTMLVSDDLSEVSVLTDDQRFQSEDWGERIKGVSSDLSNTSEEDQPPLIPSTDFFQIHMQSNKILHVMLENINFSVLGKTGHSRNIELNFERINMQGEGDSELLSLKPSLPYSFNGRGTPVKEVHVGVKRMWSLESTNQLRLDHAITLSFLETENNRVFQFDSAKIIVTLDFKAISKILKFASSPNVLFPVLLQPLSAKDELRHFLARKPTEYVAVALLNSAFRLHGFELVLPKLDHNNDLMSCSNESSNTTLNKDFAAAFTVQILEIYSGAFLEELGTGANDEASKQSAPISCFESVSRRLPTPRRLEMVDVDALSESHNLKPWVVAASGINFVVGNISGDGESYSAGLLEMPVNVEVLITLTDSSVFEMDLPKQRLLAEVSSMHIVLSALRAQKLSLVATSALEFARENCILHVPPKDPPPRLEVLSSMFLTFAEVSLKRVRVSIVCDATERTDVLDSTLKETVMEEALSDFVSCLSCFDLKFPNEEALIAAMQICMDRLVAIGLPEEDALNCASMVRIKFLQDIALIKRTQSQTIVQLAKTRKQRSQPQESPDLVENLLDEDFREPNDDESMESFDIIETTIRSAVERTVAAFVPFVEESTNSSRALNEVLAIELSSGARLSAAAMFYDTQVRLDVATIAVFSSSGLHLLRLDPMPLEKTQAGNTKRLDAQDTNSQSLSGETGGSGCGISFSSFFVDNGHEFGLGGFPLSILGIHEESADTFKKLQREILRSLELHEVELTLSSDAADSMLSELKAVQDALFGKSRRQSKEQDLMPSKTDATGFIVTAAKVSIALVSDELVPFALLTVIESMGKNSTKQTPEGMTSLVFSANSLSVIDLTPEGQCYPASVGTTKSSGRTEHILLTFYQSCDPWQQGSYIEVDFKGLRLVVLGRFLFELIQFFTSTDHGIGRLLTKYSREIAKDAFENPAPPLRYCLRLKDSSILMPASSSSLDMLELKVTVLAILNSFQAESFVLPTKSEPYDPTQSVSAQQDLQISSSTHDSFHDCVDASEHISTQGISSFDCKSISRLTVVFQDLYLFTALPVKSATTKQLASPAFLHCYNINSAESGKPVYSERDTQIDAGEFHNYEQLVRRWDQINSKAFSLELTVEFAPCLRVRVSNNVSNDANHALPDPIFMDVRLSQFCLMLSLWYSNMQEMPVFFPYSKAQVEKANRSTPLPSSFPEYGSDRYLEVLKDTSKFTFEFAILLSSLSLTCSFDEQGYFEKDPTSFSYLSPLIRASGNKPGVKLTFTGATLHVTNDRDGILRIGCGATGFEMNDEMKGPYFQKVISLASGSRAPNMGTTNMSGQPVTGSWADLSWGIDSSVQSLNQDLPQAFQMTVYMTPSWTFVNLGIEPVTSVLFNLSPIWTALEFFASYFSDVQYGNPLLEAYERTEKLKEELCKEAITVRKPHSRNIDFRLWLRRPLVVVPGSTTETAAPCLRLESETGVWYRFLSIQSLTSHEIISSDLSVTFSSDFTAIEYRNHAADWENSNRELISGLSFSTKISFHKDSNHTDVSLRIPFTLDNGKTSNFDEVETLLPPMILNSPTICSPFEQPTRQLGSRVCELTCVFETLPKAMTLLIGLLTGSTKSDSDAADFVTASSHSHPTFSATASVESVRLFFIDHVLEEQLPVAVLSVSTIAVTTSYFGHGGMSDDIGVDAPTGDVQTTIDGHFWADYFKLGVTRSWEPLLEPYHFVLLYETSKVRGLGLTLSSDSLLHVNISSAMLVILEEVIESFLRIISESFFHESGASVLASFSRSGDNVGAVVADQFDSPGGSTLQVVHQVPISLQSEDRVAFSFLNLTGQQIRIFRLQASSKFNSKQKGAFVTYLDHSVLTKLQFDATISVAKNLSMVEVPYPGLPNSPQRKMFLEPRKHAIDVQIPGFKWIEGIKVDTLGRKFESLIPKSSDLLAKVERDWRLVNVMKVLVEVGLDNGGRLITVRSVFEVRNYTKHTISLLLHPNPRHQPSVDLKIDESRRETNDSNDHKAKWDATEILEPGESSHLPTLLMQAALSLKGSHLGCLWIRPHVSSTDNELLLSHFAMDERRSLAEASVQFCSRPVQLASIVNESAVMFLQSKGGDIFPELARSGIQVSCPIANVDGEQAPFCYAIEVRRSPLVRSDVEIGQALGSSDSVKQITSNEGSARKNRSRDRVATTVHCPVTYTLSVHPPLVITNLLPQSGRFELMHATRRTVMWYADLEAGEQIPIHSVGLDAPLLLLINLGFCRTPVGEGALIHHGSDSAMTREHTGGLKSIGKAVTKGTKKIGKTLTAISDSPDRRGRGRLLMMQQPQTFSSGEVRSALPTPASGKPLGLEIEGSFDVDDGKVHAVESTNYVADDVATETTVVDSVGQRLTLRIENIRGGGGQRKITLFCPFWIVNTTEHSLRYSQEKGKSYVSGTVVGPTKDGSKPVDGSNRNYVDRHGERMNRRVNGLTSSRQANSRETNSFGTIFNGTPGALATFPGRCDLSEAELAQLIDKDLPLGVLSGLAFMFNFHDDVLSIGHQGISVQLADGTGFSRYTSDWSQSFSLDSVGVSHVCGMHCKEGRYLEVSVGISLGLGVLAGYTKIVRFLPRYVLVNQLDHPIRLWQDSSVFRPVAEERLLSTGYGFEASHDNRRWRYRIEEDGSNSKVNQYESLFGKATRLEERNVAAMPEGTMAHRAALYITTVDSSEMLPFQLPDTRRERQLRIDLGGTWNLTASFASELPGEHSLQVTRAFDFRMLRHIATRASPLYRVALPPVDNMENWDGELGVWFETDWGGTRRVIVKKTMHGRYAFNHTDIHVGDELLRIDGAVVSQMTFSEAMKLLKERMSQVSAMTSETDMTDTGKRTRPRRRSAVALADPKNVRKVQNDARDRLVLTFRTLEERVRRVRAKAARSAASSTGNNMKLPREFDFDAAQNDLNEACSDDSSDNDGARSKSHIFGNIKVDMKVLNHSMFVILRHEEPDNAPFRIENRVINHTLLFRQRGCTSHPWRCLKPGESCSYSWEEPMRPKKLSVRVALHWQRPLVANPQLLPTNSDDEKDSLTLKRATESAVQVATETEIAAKARALKLKQILSYQYVDDEEQGGLGPIATVRLEEIGFQDVIGCPPMMRTGCDHLVSGGSVKCNVDTDGSARILVVADEMDSDSSGAIVRQHVATLVKQIRNEQERSARLRSLLSRSGLLVDIVHEEESKHEVDHGDGSRRYFQNHPTAAMIEKEAKQLMDDFPEDSFIESRHQVVVEVMEATGLKPPNYVGSCNPYVEVSLKGRNQMKNNALLFRKKTKRKTYYIENTLTPKWIRQCFVFGVPAEAVSVTRGHALRVNVRSFRLVGKHPTLGLSTIHLGSIRNQKELEGWYPLVAKGGRELEDPLSTFARGSVKLRVQWIYTVSSLVDYFLLLSERRLMELERSKEGMLQQLNQAVDRASDLIGTKGKLKLKATPGRTRHSTKTADDAFAAKRSRVSLLMRDPLLVSRDRHLWDLYLQTNQSRRQRKNVDDANVGSIPIPSGELSGGLKLTSIDEIDHLAVPFIEASSFANKGYTDEELTASDSAGGLSQTGYQYANDGPQSTQTRERTSTEIEAARQRVAHDNRRRSLSEGQVARIRPFLARRFSLALSEGSNHDSSEFGSCAEAENIIASNSEDESKRDIVVDSLFSQGLVFHKSGDYAHRVHLAHHFRQSLIVQTSVFPRSLEFIPKSPLRVAPSMRLFRSAVAAWVALNDCHLITELHDGGVLISWNDALKDIQARPIPTNPSTLDLIDKKLGLPDSAPNKMQSRATNRAAEFVNSRKRFDRACKISLKSVLNPGGWLTVRPITALNLPDSFTGMFVRLRYGSEVLVSDTVDAKVTPTWTNEGEHLPVENSQMSFATDEERNLGERQEEYFRPERFKFCDNDLSVYVEPQKASGTLRLSVVGERLNSKIELGVLHISLGDAIACCLEEMEDFTAARPVNRASAPMYVRWFPLMSPKDSIAVEGDMGLSDRPIESEKISDSMFHQYFAPCIKLALIWWPDHAETGRNQVDVSESPVATMYLNADLGRLSAALIDSQRGIELFSFTALDTDIGYSVTSEKTRTSIDVGWLQLDHQFVPTREPVVLAPTPVEHADPTFEFYSVKDNLRSKSTIISYEFIAFAFQEMDLTVEESWLFDLWDFFVGIVRRRETYRKVHRKRETEQMSEASLAAENHFQSDVSNEPTLLLQLAGSLLDSSTTDTRIYVEQLILGPIKINLSYIKGKKQTWETDEPAAWVMKTMEGASTLPEAALLAAGGILLGGTFQANSSQSEAFLKWSQNTYDDDLWDETGGSRTQSLPGIIAAVFPSVSDAPIRLHGKALENVFESPEEILASVKDYYMNETLRQLYKIIGALDFVGNPTQLFTSVVSGVKDLVVAPSLAFLRSPTNPSGVGIGVAKGTISLFSHSTSGVFGFTAKMAAAAGQAVATLTFDADYREWHREVIVTEATNLTREYKKRGVKSVPAMVARPLYDILLGAGLGVSGFFTSPYKGYRADGNAGLVRGIAVGTVGLAAKPVVGILDAFTHFLSSVHDIAKSVNVLDRRFQQPRKLRLAYTFGLRNVLLPYDVVASRSATLLREFPLRERQPGVTGPGNPDAWREIHVASEVLHLEPGIDTYAIATTHRVLLAKLKKDPSGFLLPILCWEVPLKVGGSISSQVTDHGHNGVRFTITRRGPKAKVGIRSPARPGVLSVLSDYPLVRTASVDRLSDKVSNDDLNANVENAPLNDAPYDESLPIYDRSFHQQGSSRRRGGETIEWFTVVAEFHHRRQLTRLHNAVCCIVGEFGAIVYEQGLGSQPGTEEGYTLFGSFYFDPTEGTRDKPVEDSLFPASSLDNLPWLHTSTILENQDRSYHEQIRSVEEIRKHWVYSDETEASQAQGGPDWLIEARARAMFVPPPAPPLPLNLDPDDDEVQGILTALEQGNISLQDAKNAIQSIASAQIQKSPLRALPRMQAAHRLGRMGSSDVSGELESSLQSLEFEAFGFKSAMDFMTSQSDMDAESAPKRKHIRFDSTDEEESLFEHRRLPPAPLAGGHRSPDDTLQRRSKRRLNAQDSQSPADQGKQSPDNALKHSAKTMPHDRLDRMEALMEQLILLNAPPALRAAYTGGSPAGSAGLDAPEQPELAAYLRSQIEELRSQINEKDKKVEEDALAIAELREEIAALQIALAQRQGQHDRDLDQTEDAQEVQAAFLAPPQLAQSWPVLDRTRRNDRAEDLNNRKQQRKSPRMSIIRSFGNRPRRRNLDEVFGPPIQQQQHHHQQQTDEEIRKSILKRNLVNDLASFAGISRTNPTASLNSRASRPSISKPRRSILRKSFEDGSKEFI